MNERKTEIITREYLEKSGYYSDYVSVEEQQSDNPRIAKLLKQASKRGTSRGMPEFIISSDKFPNLIIVIECKADTKKHISTSLDRFDSYACDGALLYASYLSKEFDVIAIGVSGESKSEIKIDCFLQLEKEPNHIEFGPKTILPFQDFYNLYIQTPEKFNVDYNNLLSYTQRLNKKLHQLKIKESQRSLLISSILIALKNPAFISGYKKHKTAKQLTESLVQTVVYELDDSNIPKEKISNLTHAYTFIKTHTILSTKKDKLEDLISEIDQEINGFISTYQFFDTLGQFYIEFLRYANNDKGLGIVLTPPHITELFAEIALVNKDSIILDNCCGTGGFLISCMKKMVDDCNGDSSKIAEVKNNQIIGIEYQDDIYALAISNMILQDDGKSSIKNVNCFDIVNEIRNLHPNIGLLNPPYKSEKTDREELEFVINNLEMLEVGGTCISLIPISCVLADKGENYRLKQKLMDHHTIEAVMSLPEDLFHNSKVGVITCALVITAKIPHPNNKKTWLGYWRNDGFIKVKGKGRIDKKHKWQVIKDKWVSTFLNRDVEEGYSVKQILNPEDEWCVEAYLKTDYSKIDQNAFEKELRKYIAFDLTNKS